MADYPLIDGAGRQDSKLLSRSAALAYAAESMRLTTRLMQVASWLLVQRAVREGDMAAESALDASYRLAAEASAEVFAVRSRPPPRRADVRRRYRRDRAAAPGSVADGTAEGRVRGLSAGRD